MKPYKKIAVIGCSGSGKTTLATALGARWNLPVHHLDLYFWLPNWVERDYQDFRALHHELCAKSEWIIDGSQVRTIADRALIADLVIFLDVPRRICLWRIIKRRWQNRCESRFDLPEGCPERLTLKFLLYVWRYPKRYKPGVIAILDEVKKTKPVIILHSHQEIADFLGRV
ncbi:hypothetical protein K2W90_06020 [Candidatus Babeliales bacterium]|nr:hypothetical protein [Candidatus Babeliales bacterium]